MSRVKANALLLLTAFIWGTAFVAQQQGMDHMGPVLFTALRFLMGALVVLPLLIFQIKKSGFKMKSDYLSFSIICGIFLFGGSVCQQIGLTDTTVTNAGFLTGLYVPLVPIIMLIIWQMKPHWSIWPAALGAFIGMFLLSGARFDAFSQGDLWVIIGAFFWAMQVIYVGFAVRKTNEALFVAFIQFVVCSLLAFPVALWMEDMAQVNITLALPDLLYTGILSVGVAFTLQVVAQKHTPAADAAIILSGEILFAAIAGAIIQDERLDLIGYIGATLIFLAILSVELIPLFKKRKTNS